ncbi:MAG: formylglycine-generating enzyme family protein [Verrucomicrobia bacterium]|nr:formylglycine-generating enzyme family protein [Verrucomicrobiota bacterium]
MSTLTICQLACNRTTCPPTTSALESIADAELRGSVADFYQRLPRGRWSVTVREITIALPEHRTEKRWVPYFTCSGIGTRFVHGGGANMEFAYIGAGEFVMGSPETEANRQETEGPQHAVAITQPFLMGASEVTIGEFLQYLNETGNDAGVDLSHFWCPVEKSDGRYRMKSESFPFWGSTRQPMMVVSWEAAQSYCRWLSVRIGPELEARLPTEAEWEYACRAGTRGPYSFGETISTDFAKIAEGVEEQGTVPAASFPANPWGLYDMHGNVAELCSDWFNMDRYEIATDLTTDPTGPPDGRYRVVRGGSWSGCTDHCRSAARLGVPPTSRALASVGFRVVVSFR